MIVDGLMFDQAVRILQDAGRGLKSGRHIRTPELLRLRYDASYIWAVPTTRTDRCTGCGGHFATGEVGLRMSMPGDPDWLVHVNC